MKSYRIRPNSIADKAIKTADKIDTEPFATITFMGVMSVAIGLFCYVINTIYPLV